MRRSDYDDENEVEKNVTIKSMIISMIRVGLFFVEILIFRS